MKYIYEKFNDKSITVLHFSQVFTSGLMGVRFSRISASVFSQLPYVIFIDVDGEKQALHNYGDGKIRNILIGFLDN